MNRRSCLALALAASTTLCLAQAQKAPAKFEPHSGQPGKDVVWVPTPQALVDKMLDMAKVTKDDYVMDLGSGDGRTVITAAKRGATALGVEYNPDMVELSRRAAAKEGVSARASFVKADLFDTDFSKATVVTMFLLPSINLKLRPKILALKPGTRIVSNSFTMEDWEADEVARLGPEVGCHSFCTAYFWVVPAKVAGTHKLPQGELTLKQEFQALTGTLRTDSGNVEVTGKVLGDEVYLAAGPRAFHGKFSNGVLRLD